MAPGPRTWTKRSYHPNRTSFPWTKVCMTVPVAVRRSTSRRMGKTSPLPASLMTRSTCAKSIPSLLPSQPRNREDSERADSDRIGRRQYSDVEKYHPSANQRSNRDRRSYLYANRKSTCWSEWDFRFVASQQSERERKRSYYHLQGRWR